MLPLEDGDGPSGVRSDPWGPPQLRPLGPTPTPTPGTHPSSDRWDPPQLRPLGPTPAPTSGTDPSSDPWDPPQLRPLEPTPTPTPGNPPAPTPATDPSLRRSRVRNPETPCTTDSSIYVLAAKVDRPLKSVSHSKTGTQCPFLRPLPPLRPPWFGGARVLGSPRSETEVRDGSDVKEDHGRSHVCPSKDIRLEGEIKGFSSVVSSQSLIP